METLEKRVVESHDAGLDRFCSPPPIEPNINIYGEVRWPKEWSLEECRQYIQHCREMETLRNADPDYPHGDVAILEYSLDPKGRVKPDYLGALKQCNPRVKFPETYKDGTPTWVDKELVTAS